MARLSFEDPEFVARYEEGPRRFVPGHYAMRLMAAQLLEEMAGPAARILVLGAGGGLELNTFSNFQRGWRFLGVDPSPEMLRKARDLNVGAADRIQLIHGLIEDAPLGPFDAATCLLTLHFVPDDGSKLAILQALRKRLKPSAPLLLVDLCIDGTAPDRLEYLDRYARFASLSGARPQDVELAKEQVRTKLEMVGPAREEELLVEAGFSRIELFYAGFSWRGWSMRA